MAKKPPPFTKGKKSKPMEPDADDKKRGKKDTIEAWRKELNLRY